MDPYLEQPNFWSSFHFRLIREMASAIAPYILPKYYCLGNERECTK
ncbi:MAG: DUF4058 family protein [Oculatellaceae cyanobacterium Prado106]|nr:DUF4058 family protein [Oculatellaceae cyanobacterium Prado106]